MRCGCRLRWRWRTFSGIAAGGKVPGGGGGVGTGLGPVHPVPGIPPALRKVLYTTNAIESFNREMRKVLKTRTQFPNDDAVIKTLWLAILDIEDKRAEQRAKQAGQAGERAERGAAADRGPRHPGLARGLGGDGGPLAGQVRRPHVRFTGVHDAGAGQRVRAGSVPLDALDAEEIADLLGPPPWWPVRWPATRRPRRLRRARAEGRSLAGLHVGLAIAAADLDEAIEDHTGILHP